MNNSKRKNRPWSLSTETTVSSPRTLRKRPSSTPKNRSGKQFPSNHYRSTQKSTKNSNNYRSQETISKQNTNNTRKLNRKELNYLQDVSDEEGEEQEELRYSLKHYKGEMSPDIAQINRMVKELRLGSMNKTIMALSFLQDTNLHDEKNQIAVIQTGGDGPLLGLLGSDNYKLLSASLTILKRIIKSPRVQFHILENGGVKTILKNFDNRSLTDELRGSLCYIIARLCEMKLARRQLRINHGIGKLIKLLSNPNVSPSAAHALCKSTESSLNQHVVGDMNGIAPIISFLDSHPCSMLSHAIGCLMNLANIKKNRRAILHYNGSTKIIKLLHKTYDGLEVYSVVVEKIVGLIYLMSEEEEFRVLVQQNKALPILAHLLNTLEEDKYHQLFVFTISALWKSAQRGINAEIIEQLSIPTSLINCVKDYFEDDQLMTPVFGALAQLSTHGKRTRDLLVKNNMIETICELLQSRSSEVIIQACCVLAESAQDERCLQEIFKSEGIRMLWSLLRHHNYRVEATAAYAISKCITTRRAAIEVGRTLFSYLSVLVNILQNSKVNDVRANVCLTMAQLCLYENNKAILTDEGVVPILADLIHVDHHNLRKASALAIGNVCSYKNNRIQFSKLGVILPLLDCLRNSDQDQEDLELMRNACQALQRLSEDDKCARDLLRYHAVEQFIECIGSSDEALQEACAETISNMRYTHSKIHEKQIENPISS